KSGGSGTRAAAGCGRLCRQAQVRSNRVAGCDPANDMKKTRVMIVEDSPVIRALLEYCVASDPRLEVCATAGSAEEALDTYEEIAPDVIAIDINLPGIDGLEATRSIMSTKPVPIVVVASSIESGKW